MEESYDRLLSQCFCPATAGGSTLGQEDQQQEAILDLRSLGINPRKKNERDELADLAEAIKQAMYDDYKTAYGEKGDRYEHEARSTVSP
jgi:hypothetical protein